MSDSIRNLIASAPFNNLYEHSGDLYEMAEFSYESRRRLFTIDEHTALVCDASNTDFTVSPIEHLAAHIAFAEAANQFLLARRGEGARMRIIIGGTANRYGIAEGRIALVVEKPEGALFLYAALPTAPHLIGAGHMSFLDYFFAGSFLHEPRYTKLIVDTYLQKGLDRIYKTIAGDKSVYRELTSRPEISLEDAIRIVEKRTGRIPVGRRRLMETVEEFVEPAITLIEEGKERVALHYQQTHIDTLIHELAHAAGFVYGLVEWLGDYSGKLLKQVIELPEADVRVKIDSSGTAGTTSVGWIYEFARRELGSEYGALAILYCVYHAMSVAPTIVGLLASSPDYMIAGWAAGLAVLNIQRIQRTQTWGLAELSNIIPRTTSSMRADKRALLAFIRRMIQYIRSHPEFGPSLSQFIKQPHRNDFEFSIPLVEAVKLYASVRG